MNVLVIGSGGREHALAWKLAQSEQVGTVYVAPGNAGTASEPDVENVAIAVDDFNALSDFAASNHVGLTVIGPEAPLVDGIVDHFTSRQLPCFGPSASAAQLEGSKAFTKDFLARHNIPSAAYQTFTDPEKAVQYVEQQGTPIVIKADGLAAGKGVIIAETLIQAQTAITDMLEGNRFGEAGHRVVIEEFLEGEEASFIVVTDGKTIVPMATSQDHKRIGNGDTGPNTGGMGAYSPAPVVTEAVHQRIMREVIEPTVRGMAQEGNNYTGFLYAGLMITSAGEPKVIEYNCRFGDPETQPIMMRLNSDFATLCLATINGTLATAPIAWSKQPALGVVLAAGGYPNDYHKGDTIEGLNKPLPTGVKIFHAGTSNAGDATVTNGGRVVCVTALGEGIGQAQSNAYNAIKNISWSGMQYRSDIGYRAIEKENAH